jgi:type II secretory pathway pseudopilin PulG
MKNTKTAFTLIELIFIIVVIGILASVAIPKLSATRDDAKVSILSKAVNTFKSEVSTYILATGKIPKTAKELKSISNTISGLPQFVIVSDKVINILDTDNGSEVCKKIRIDDTDSSNIHLIIADGEGNSNICQGVKRLVPDSNINFTISGNIINY